MLSPFSWLPVKALDNLSFSSNKIKGSLAVWKLFRTRINYDPIFNSWTPLYFWDHGNNHPILESCLLMLLIFIIIIYLFICCCFFFAKEDNICFSFRFIKTMKIFVLCSCLLSVLFEPCTSDIYFHFPPGSNNRLNGNGVNRRNARRLFDSQVITNSSLYWSLESVHLIA